MSQPQEGPFTRLFVALRSGEIDRRQFVQGAMALGMTASAATWCAGTVAAQDATPAPGAGTRPTAGTENQERGAGGDLKIIQWQAPSHLSALQATGDKDNLGACLVSESLMALLPDATRIPILITEVPTVDNGLLGKDLKSVTFKLLEGVKWSDGEPFTADDVVFTWQWVMDDTNAAPLQALWQPIKDMKAEDDLTVTVTYAEPNPTWADAFTGMGSTVVYPKHVLEGGGQEANDAFRLNPIGTGPYVVDSFSPNDAVSYKINDNYREPNKPYFATVQIKGGGDPASAARAVIQTGEYDYAWNLSVEPEVLKDMESDSSPGVLDVRPGTSVERININFSDPNKEVDGQKSHFGTPHPILSDDAVRMAMRLGIDREKIANSFYFGGDLEPAVANILVGIPAMASPNQKLDFDPDTAKKTLEDAGWTGDGTRKKDNLELKLRLTTTVNQVRQKTQQVVKANLEDIGFEIQLEQIDSGIFFDSSAGNDQSNTHFYTDMNMFTSGVGAPPPVAFMIRWYAGPNNEEIAQKENEWAGRNIHRWKNEEYDKLYDQAKIETDPEKQAELFIKLNDLVIDNNVVIPLVSPGNKQAYSRTLNADNISVGPFEFDYWNIANWNRVAE